MTDPRSALDRLLRMARLLEEDALGELRRQRRELEGIEAAIAALSDAGEAGNALLAPAARAAWEAWRSRRRDELEAARRDLAGRAARAEAGLRVALGRRVALERMLRTLGAERRARDDRRRFENLSFGSPVDE